MKDGYSGFPLDSSEQRTLDVRRVGIILVIVIAAIAAWRFIPQGITELTFETSGDIAVQDSTVEQDKESVGKEAEELYAVYVTGAVREPGVYQLGGAARIGDAVEAAGGLTETASAQDCNLAEHIQDGMHIHIPVEGEQKKADPNSNADVSAGSLVNINTADHAALKSLPGIGDATADKIIADRDASGPFANIEDLMRVSGIGQKKFDAIRNLICV